MYVFSIQKKTTTSITSQSPDNSMALVHLPPISPEVCVYRYYIHVIYAYTLQCLYALHTVCILLFCIQDTTTASTPCTSQSTDDSAALLRFPPISPEVHCTVYHRFIIPEYHIIIIIIIIVCIYTSLHALHIHLCLFCIQETTTTPMPCSIQSTNDLMAVVGLPPNWTDVSFGAQGLRLCRVTYQELPGTAPLVVTHSLIVKQDCSWALNVHGHTVDSSKVPSLQSFPDKLSGESVTLLLNEVADLHTCIGNPEQKYTVLGEAKKYGQFLSANKEVVAYIDRNACVTVGDQQYPTTVRSSKCHLLTSAVRCSVCTGYRKSLNAQHSRALCQVKTAL